MSAVPATPASHWRIAGQSDPHAGRFDCERAALPMGGLTDDELANALVLCDHRASADSGAYLAAAQARIRWLSRTLQRTAGEPAP